MANPTRDGVEAAILLGGLIADTPELRHGIERMLDDRQVVTRLPRGVRLKAKNLLSRLAGANGPDGSPAQRALPLLDASFSPEATQ